MGIRRSAAILIALVIVASGCNSRLLRPPATINVDDGQSSVTAAVLGKNVNFPAVLLAFLPSRVLLHPNDQLRFDARFNGEPHVIALGSLIDRAAQAIGRLGPTPSVGRVEKLPEMRDIPSVFPFDAGGERPAVNRSAADPCFLDEGSPPNSETGGAPACAKRAQPVFDGKFSFYSSGYLPEGEGFRIKLAGDIKPGSYSFMCLVHRSQMIGSFDVVAPDTSRPNVRQVKLAGIDEERIVAATVSTAALNAALSNAKYIYAGAGPTGEIRGLASAYIPRDSTVRAGDPVTWRFFGMHTISFRPGRRARDGILLQESGGTKVNLAAWRPVKGPEPAGALGYLPPKARLEIDGGTWDGKGTFSSGVVRATPPSSVFYTLRFSAPGTYDYVCLVHSQMRGRLVVK